MAAADLRTHDYDVVVIGAGGAGLRAAIEAGAQKAKVALVCKSLLGKAHTVMAEGGAAAALGNVMGEDNWRVHFRDTMRGGKMHNNWRMAQIHAQEAPDRIKELEACGALFDRTPDGRINQRPFGGHTYSRLAHVGDRTGLEMIRVLQGRAVHSGLDVHMECTIVRLFVVGGRVAGALGYFRETGRFVLFRAGAVVLATGGIGKAWQITSNSWEYTGDGHALAYAAGAELIDMEFVQFHPTGMVWPPGVRGILVTEGVRGEGGILKNATGERFMFRYMPDMFKGDFAETEAEADAWVKGDRKQNRRPPELLTRDVVAKAIVREIAEGRGTEHGGVLLVFGRRAGLHAAAKRGAPPSIPDAEVEATMREALQPFERDGENPFAVQSALQAVMQRHASIIRDKSGLETALTELEKLKRRAGNVGITGSREYNPGWHTAIDLRSLLVVSEATARAALERTESRGAHTRSDYPDSDERQAREQIVIKKEGERMVVRREAQPPLPADLIKLIKEGA